MSKSFLFVLTLLTASFATQIIPFQNITNAKLKAFINATTVGGDPSCWPGDINIIIGAMDYSDGVGFMSNPFNEAAIWQTVVGTLAPGALTFEYSMNVTTHIEDLASTPYGTPLELNLTSIFQQITSSGNPLGKAYVICFMVNTGSGKTFLLSDESNTPYDSLLGIEITDISGMSLFKYRKGGDPINNIQDRIQFTGSRTAVNQVYYTDFRIGGHEPSPYGGPYPDDIMDYCGFFFHRGLAAKLGWHDPEYPNDTLLTSTECAFVAINLSLSLQNSPNPVSSNTVISYSLDKNTSIQLGIYDINGKRIQDLAHGIQNPGTHSLSWNCSNVSKGIYFMQLKTKDRTLIKKLAIM